MNNRLLTREFFTRYRSYLLYSLLIVAFFSVPVVAVLHATRAIDGLFLQVDASRQIIQKNLEVGVRIERMTANARGYVLSGDRKFAAQYDTDKAETSDLIAEMSTLMQDNTQQYSKLSEMQRYFVSFTQKLDAERQVQPGGKTGRIGAEQVIDAAKGNIIRIQKDIALTEQKLLDDQTQEVERHRKAGSARILVSCFSAIIVFLAFTVYILRTGFDKRRAKRDFDEAQEVFRLAVEGSNDGIFDWNLKNGKAFYSKQFWGMLGYERGEVPSTLHAFQEMLHPDDKQRVMDHFDRYLSGELSEYLIVFRMRHQSGRWIWINARGRALFEDGKPYRMVGAHTDISHVKAYEEKLERARDLAEKASRAKTDFLAHMSHEIRTPLTAISGIAEIFDGIKDTLDAKQRMLVKTLNSSTSSLKDLVNDILDFSKIESGEMELDEKSFSLRELFEQVISIVSIRSNEKGIRFSFDFDDVGGISYLGDRVRLRQILINLIGNAIKFTAEGSVEVRAQKIMRDNSPFLKISVVDTGIGIEPQNQELVFERFKQADPSVSRKYGGTGLGLPISVRLAHLMGGHISMESTFGKGSTFTLVIPIRAAEQTGEEAAQDVNTALNESLKGQNLSGKNILLVEDYEGNIVLLTYLLDGLKCRYDIARTGLEALNMWKDKAYDLILMDIQMPEMDGFTATATIRQIEKERNMIYTPIIGMTAHALVGDREKCIEAGMDAYLPKPIVELDLKTKIMEFITQEKKVA